MCVCQSKKKFIGNNGFFILYKYDIMTVRKIIG